MPETIVKWGVRLHNSNWDHIFGIFFQGGDWNGQKYFHICIAYWFGVLHIGKVLKEVKHNNPICNPEYEEEEE